MTKAKVSVIVPCYNVAPWVGECLDSLLQQTFSEIEIICINDGSTDETGAILESYANQDRRISLWNQKNTGVSAARNRGIEMSKTPYIMFVDPDDWIDKECIQTVYDKITQQNVDMVIFGCKCIIDGQEKWRWEESWLKEHAKLPPAPMNLDNDSLSRCTNCWGRLIRKEFLLLHQIQFPVGIKTAEDVIFCQILAFHHPIYIVLDKHFYNYRAWNGITGRQADQCILYDLKAFQYFHNQPIFQAQPLTIQMHVVNKFMAGSRNYWNRNPHYQSVYKKDIDTFYDYLTKNYSKKNLKKAPLFKWLSNTHLGINRLCSVRLFGFLPLGHWIDKGSKKSFQSMGITFFKIKKKNQRIVYFFWGIPVIRIQW